jgi:hypothetical protein
MAPKFVERMNDYFLTRGNMWLIIITAIEVIFYIAYTVLYSLDKKDEGIDQQQIYRWTLTAVLLLSIIYFLWNSVSTLLQELPSKLLDKTYSRSMNHNY